jgi:hypothetical protein
MIAFQFPIDFTNDAGSVSYTQLGEERNFQSLYAPVLTNDGRSLYYGVTGSLFLAWTGEAGVSGSNFSGDPAHSAGFTPGTAVSNPSRRPALSSDPAQPFIFGGTAANEFIRLSWDFDETQKIVKVTDSKVVSQAQVSSFDDFVYYIEENGQVHQADFNTLRSRWIFSFVEPHSIEGAFALKSDQSMMYFASNRGANNFVTALRISEDSTEPPTASPPTSAPVQTCQGSNQQCSVPSDCCSNRCSLNQCKNVKQTTGKFAVKLGGEGRGGAAGKRPSTVRQIRGL